MTVSERTLVEPWLIQRAGIRKPLSDVNETTLSNSVSFDYMGSSEFEFGALPSSLRRMRDRELKIRLVKGITHEQSPLRVLSYLDDKMFHEYEQTLFNLRFGNPRLKEVSRFNHDYPNRDSSFRTDFWWDIENDVMWSFDKIYMNRLPDYLRKSFSVMS